MRFIKSLSFIALITLTALLYVHQQIELVKLSYDIEIKQAKLKDVLDRSQALGYNIDNLEDPSRLEGVLLARKIDITFPKKGNVVNVARTSTYLRNGERVSVVGFERKANILKIFDFFSPPGEAQAKEK